MNHINLLNEQYESGALPLWRYIQRATYLVFNVAPKRKRIQWANAIKYYTVPVSVV